ncbi:MAG TPA: ABC transporter ATP-binding protein [Puia sp.]|uniref:ABC transporter ATP-binding protein n=1 Tax=Puia sp. TaxID=2045100 RepID=UPI002C619AD3|nr:ABC transporter ATP-binding protein [Puia sp.]HVU96250.1 ABC transporter ATP-binding protein [Puia sp.]
MSNQKPSLPTGPKGKPPKGPSLLPLLKPYRRLILLLILLALVMNTVNLGIPKIIQQGIDSFIGQRSNVGHVVTLFMLAAVGVFILTWGMTFVQTYASEKVARDLRTQLAGRISRQNYSFLSKTSPAQLLTNLTADVDSIKTFISTAIPSIFSSVFTIVGASVFLMTINWRLALCVIAIIPIIGVTFFVILKKVRALFIASREVIDWLNKVINESILGAALIRVIQSQQLEYAKFLEANAKALHLGLRILKTFATLIPVIIFTANMATLTILALGGHYVINGTMSLGDFAAFNLYLTMLIFPILVIGFMSNVIAQAQAAYARISGVLNSPDPVETGTLVKPLEGQIELRDVTVAFGEKEVLKDISFSVAGGSKTAVIGPTAAGKTQLLYLLTGLNQPNSGTITFDGQPLENYRKEEFHRQVGFVFQDSIIFNMSIRENIAFGDSVSDAALQKAIATAELADFIGSLPERLDTVVSERGTTLSGGQKQRIMLARALAIEPRVLLLDDFTARVDTQTEQKILANVRQNYPGITLLSVTQKIASIEDYEQIVLLMEGELVASGTHEHLMATCPEYVQIYQSQRSTSHYEQPQLQS